MAQIQKHFIQFHEAIQLENLDENATLREKRDLLLDKLRAGLDKKFKDEGKKAPGFRHRNLGSYQIGTGIKPTGERDYDIDVGLFFQLKTTDYGPVEVKQWVYDILNVHPHTAEIRRPCVTVWYREGDAPKYHVDFAVFSDGDQNDDGMTRIAKGFPGSKADLKVWEVSEPERLLTVFGEKFEGDDRLQYRRAIRYLKRWKDFQFPSRGEGAPRGIGLTCAAWKWFQPSYTLDPLTGKRRDDDLKALHSLMRLMLSNFVPTWTGEKTVDRLATPLPVTPNDDPFLRMSDRQMGIFQGKLTALRDALWGAQEDVDPVEACKRLRDQFGPDFPVPETDDTGERSRGPSIITTGHFG